MNRFRFSGVPIIDTTAVSSASSPTATSASANGDFERPISEFMTHER